MLQWVVICLVLCIILGIIGYSGRANKAKGVVKAFFFIFLILFLVLLGYYIFQSYYAPQMEKSVKMPTTSVPNP